jgi:hypothetical protein
MFELFGALNQGDRVVVHVKNDAPIGGQTQRDSFDIEVVEPARVRGTDPSWGTEETLAVEDGELMFHGAMKSGPVQRVERMDTTSDGITIHGSEDVLFERGGA